MPPPNDPISKIPLIDRIGGAEEEKKPEEAKGKKKQKKEKKEKKEKKVDGEQPKVEGGE